MNEDYLNSHRFICMDVPFSKWKYNITSFFKCVNCVIKVQVYPQDGWIVNNEKNLTCEEIIIKNIIE